jgi:hypothetical protein
MHAYQTNVTCFIMPGTTIAECQPTDVQIAKTDMSHTHCMEHCLLTWRRHNKISFSSGLWSLTTSRARPTTDTRRWSGVHPIVSQAKNSVQDRQSSAIWHTCLSKTQKFLSNPNKEKALPNKPTQAVNTSYLYRKCSRPEITHLCDHVKVDKTVPHCLSQQPT